jgi:glutaminyl-tRNA synthetase
VENPDDVPDGVDFTENLNPDSLAVIQAKVEPSVADLPIGQTIQFERKGYYCPDITSSPERLVINQTITLRDTWAKIQKRG